MRRLRDVFYINAFPKNNEIDYYGMEFKEFIKYAPIEINKIILLEAEYYSPGVLSKSKFEIVGEAEINDLLKEDVSCYGDFCWVDYDIRTNVENLLPTEIAELLYLGRMYKPVNSPFFDRINNRYAYLAHDDGYFCRLYCRYYNDFEDIISNKIVDMASPTKRRKILPLSVELKKELLSLANNGLLIDFCKLLKDERSIEIPIYVIGKFLDMSDMYNNMERYKGRASYSASLVYSNNNWKIKYIQTR